MHEETREEIADRERKIGAELWTNHLIKMIKENPQGMIIKAQTVEMMIKEVEGLKKGNTQCPDCKSYDTELKYRGAFCDESAYGYCNRCNKEV